MKCSCPKCDAIIETSHLEVSVGGSSQLCPECDDKFWAIREGFSLRAYKKQGRIYCFDCGQELGTENLCLSCGSLCPDYCIVQASKPAPRKQKRAGFDFSFARRSKDSKPKTSANLKSSSSVVSKKPAEEKAGSRWLTYAAITTLVLILVGATVNLYLTQNAEKQYSRAIVTALYGVKSGTDACLKMIDDLTSQWEEETTTGAGIIPRMSKTDRDKLGKIKSRVDQATEGLGETPEKFAEAKVNLGKLHAVYGKIYSLAVSSTGSLDEFKTARIKIEADFYKSADELKRSMPKIMQDELEFSINKYKNLEFMVKSK